jgi:hypothetical protein
VEKTIDSVNNLLFQEACPDKFLRERLQTWLQDEFQKTSAQARSELQELIKNELHAHLYTLHPNKMTKQQQLHDRRIKCFTKKVIEKNRTLVGPHAPKGETDIEPVSTETIMHSLIYKNPELVGILNTHDSLAAYYDVALYRFIDNFALQVVERHLLGPSGPLRLFNSEYVAKKLYGVNNEKELSNLADEDPETAQKRRKFEAQRASLEEGKTRLQNFIVL